MTARDKYLPTIGIETHVQLKTKTKLFSAVGNDARAAEPNSLISHIDVGLPGALPVLNRAAIELSARAALALNTAPQKFSRFERKHYFYPDLPKGYQITQLEDSIIKGGYVDVPLAGELKRVNIERANLEEDAGKNTHPAGADYSLVDLNRAGTPLLEIVSKPDMHSPAEAKAYARELWLIMKYAGVTEGDLYQGQVRFDVNVSVSNDPGKLGTRSEIKNLNSFRSVENAVNYEIKRQIELLEKGEVVVQETRGWDDAKQKSISQRSKEEAQDYRYMPEPDIPPIELDDDFTETIEENLPLLPPAIRKILGQMGLELNVIEDILDSPQACQKVVLAAGTGAPKENIRRLAFDSLEEPASTVVDLEEHLKLVELWRSKTVSSTAAKEILKAKIANPAKTIEELAAGKSQVSGEAEIEKIVDEVLAENQKAAEDVKRGEAKAIGFLVGQVMAKSKGQANPQVAQAIIKKQLGIKE
ncbi:MAG TPA: Asp-tRNA(Asn)/Glu-tRNA(Gln) amidotransferase subunit GatB [Candidatus Saccharimonadales bacterium]|nr:Asp-tRNA(Asn)/Glu-tRNA(Gln) amidotransferase subunit GatB [Candidatus Saccharimonadales bacterium]